jgi:hypothetical protein
VPAVGVRDVDPDPEAKGMIERAHDYLVWSFLPGRLCTGPTNFNTPLTEGLTLVNTPLRQAFCAPSNRIVADRAAMPTL